MEWVQFGFSALFIFVGLLVFIAGVFGVYQFKFILNRMHSAAMLDTMGLFFISLGCAVANGFNPTSIKILCVFAFLWMTSPICSHLIAKLEFITDKNLKDEIENDLEETKEENTDDSI